MNNIIAFCGMVLLSAAATPNNPETNYNVHADVGYILETSRSPWGLESCISCPDDNDINLDSIVFLEDEDPFELGFDTQEYLPEGFDPYEVYVDLHAIVFIEEEEEEINLGFDTQAWLPEGFNPYAAPADIMSISYMEEEVDFFPQLETSALLPDGFNPYSTSMVHESPCHQHITVSSL